MAEEHVRAITWEAPEHVHIEKGADWYWAVGIIGLSATVAAILLGNTLFGIVLALGTASVIIFSLRKPGIIPFSVTTRGVRIGESVYTYASLESYFIDEESDLAPQLLLKSKQLISPILVMQIPEEYKEDVEYLVSGKLPEELLEEPLSEKLLAFFGF